MARAAQRLPLAIAAAAAAALAVAAATTGGVARLHFPRDHFAHPRAGIEWWYVTGVVRGGDGHRYSVFFTLFRRAGLVLPVSQVVDLDTGALVGHSEKLAPASLGTTKLDVAVQGGSLRYRPRGNSWRFAAADGGYALALTTVAQKPYVLHGGGTGIIGQSTAGASAYYSATRMTARGTITRDGVDLPFTGTAWFDHQWGNFQDDPDAFDWDWFSCRFDDRTELMLYGFRDRNGVPLPASRNGTFVLRNGRSRIVTTFDASPGERELDAAGRRWPLDWELAVPSERLTLRLTSIVDDQLVRGTLLPTFWEGAATAAGTKTGICFVEQSYAP
jgi:predicted secreted hydrolase